ncbi:hypothetical protein [Microbulbifer aestuariivivens]|uniref:hypothetical protein n=1 Tax=Microbulbifer aestuariivivens TaxID=1908308 RepID=UPI0031ED59CB
MKFIYTFFKAFILLLFFATVSYAQTLSPEDVQDFNKTTGVGCTEKKPVSENADYYVVCKSRKSGEQAWNAAMYRSKVECSADEISVLFNLNPALPTENGIHGAQIEVNCGPKP